MSVTGNGTKGEPTFQSSGNAPTFAADLNAVSQYAASIGNRMVGTHSARLSAATWEGLQWFETDTGLSFVYHSAAWRDNPIYTVTTLTPASGWGGGDGMKWMRIGPLISVNVDTTRTGANVTIPAWTGSNLATGLPVPAVAAFAPAPAQTNQVEYGGYDFVISGTGALQLMSRWASRTFGSGGWVQGSFSYLAAS